MSIRLALLRFRELHDEYKAGVFKSPEALKFYETERDAFLTAMLEAQQLTLKPGQAARATVRVNREERLVIQLGPRREGCLTIDIGMGGFAALVGPFAAHMYCEFELGTPPDAIKGRARTVMSARQPNGEYRTSFQIMQLTDDDRRRLEILVVDTALASLKR
jgi:hypothetical protein